MAGKNRAFTLIEILIASSVFTLFMLSAFNLFIQGNKTISRSTWINNATRDESLVLRKLSELAKASSYPSTVDNDIIRVAQNDPAFRVITPKGFGTIPYSEASIDILAFPICTEQTLKNAGSIKWVSLWLEKSDFENYRNLIIKITPAISYNPGPPDYAAKMNNGSYQTGMSTAERSLLMQNIEKLSLTKATDSDKSIEFEAVLSYPQNKQLNKTIKLNMTFNLSVN